MDKLYSRKFLSRTGEATFLSAPCFGILSPIWSIRAYTSGGAIITCSLYDASNTDRRMKEETWNTENRKSLQSFVTKAITAMEFYKKILIICTKLSLFLLNQINKEINIFMLLLLIIFVWHVSNICNICCKSNCLCRYYIIRRKCVKRVEYCMYQIAIDF